MLVRMNVGNEEVWVGTDHVYEQKVPDGKYEAVGWATWITMASRGEHTELVRNENDGPKLSASEDAALSLGRIEALRRQQSRN